MGGSLGNRSWNAERVKGNQLVHVRKRGQVMRGSDQGIGPLVSLAKPRPSKGHPSEVEETGSMGYRSLSPQTRNTMTVTRHPKRWLVKIIKKISTVRISPLASLAKSRPSKGHPAPDVVKMAKWEIPLPIRRYTKHNVSNKAPRW